MKDARLWAIPGRPKELDFRAPTSAEKLLQAAHGLSDNALLDCFYVLLDRYDADTLEQLGNEIGRIAHHKSRNTAVTLK